MVRKSLGVLCVAALLSTVAMACSSSPPASQPTTPPAKAAAPTAASSQATTAPAAKVNFPEKGKTITFVVPMAPGGAIDISARVVAPLLEKELGVPVQIVNKAGAGSQTGCTEVATAKPDGYTLLYTSLPQTLGTYLDTQRQAVYSRKSFAPVAMTTDDAPGIEVKSDSPYKTLKDFVDAAKANPGKIKMGDAGIMSLTQMASLLFQKAAGVKFTAVHFDSGGATLTEILGGHVDAGIMMISASQGQLKSGAVRILAISAAKESEFAPGVPTMTSQGYKVVIGAAHNIAAPAGTPKEVVDILSNAIKKISETDEYKTKMKAAGLISNYMDSDQLASYWAQSEADVQSIVNLAKD